MTHTRSAALRAQVIQRQDWMVLLLGRGDIDGTPAPPNAPSYSAPDLTAA